MVHVVNIDGIRTNSEWNKTELKLKGTGRYWLLLKIIVIIKTYLVTSKGELLNICTSIKQCEKRLPIWTTFSRKKLFLTKIFEFGFETSEFDFAVSKLSICKHTTSCDRGVFFFATSSTNWVQIFTCTHGENLRYTKCEDWSSWQLLKVSNVIDFKIVYYTVL